MHVAAEQPASPPKPPPSRLCVSWDRGVPWDTVGLGRTPCNASFPLLNCGELFCCWGGCVPCRTLRVLEYEFWGFSVWLTVFAIPFFFSFFGDSRSRRGAFLADSVFLSFCVAVKRGVQDVPSISAVHHAASWAQESTARDRRRRGVPGLSAARSLADAVRHVAIWELQTRRLHAPAYLQDFGLFLVRPSDTDREHILTSSSCMADAVFHILCSRWNQVLLHATKQALHCNA